MTPTYTTAVDLDAASTLIAGSSLTTTDKESLILRAESVVDILVGFHIKSDITQNRIFPRVEDCDTDGNYLVPNTITDVTHIIAEVLYESDQAPSSIGDSLQPGDSVRLDDFSFRRGDAATLSPVQAIRYRLLGHAKGSEALLPLQNFTSFSFATP